MLYLRDAAVAVTMTLSCAVAARASIDGTLSNFDVFNQTETEADGAELELEGISSTDIFRTYPSHFRNETVTDYDNGVTSGVRITFHDYFFDSNELLLPTAGQTTNGHFCVNLSGCEHFGFSVQKQPTATRYYWLDQDFNRIGTTPLPVPTPTWTFVPPANPGNAPIVRAEIEVPEPAEVHQQRPDSIWVKVYKTELDRPVDLDELISNGGVVPEDAGEVETEWELLEGGKKKGQKGKVGGGKDAVLRRYEFFEYTGPYDAEHEPTSIFLDQDLPEPPEGELGKFIAANMVAANLAPALAPVLGDMDLDGDIDFDDIDDFVLGLTDASAYEHQIGVPARARGDMDADGDLDFDDINGFVGALNGQAGIGSQAVPEPGTAALVLLGIVGLGLTQCRRQSAG